MRNTKNGWIIWIMAEPQKSGTGQGLFQKKKGVNENTSIKMLLSIFFKLFMILALVYLHSILENVALGYSPK